MSNLKKHLNLDTAFYIIVFLSILTFALLQPFGDPPDEVNRYKIAQFVCRYGKLPTGEEFEVAIGGYGGSYAFQPILPYIIQGILMRFVSLFTDSNLMLLLCARMVNVLFGVIMAIYVRKTARLLFEDSLTGWLFCLLIMFLPQNLFLHSYVNTDSMASMSGAVMIYACASGWKNGWKRSDCITLSIGIVCCALSYYNAYGLIVAAILLFAFSWPAKSENGRLSVNWRSMLQKGLLISIIVLIGISWWFLRNYFIHNGDFLGLHARMENAARTALPVYNPQTKITVASSGASLADMLLHMDFLYFLWNSFVARFGPMTLPTLPFLYIWYYRIFSFGWLFCLIPSKLSVNINSYENVAVRFAQSGGRKLQCALFHIPLLLSICITFGLCVYYSYQSDYQPQGRYIMPMLIPFMYFITLGFYKLTASIAALLPVGRLQKWCRPVIMGGLMLFLTGALLLTLACVVIPHYVCGVYFWNAEWIAF